MTTLLKFIAISSVAIAEEAEYGNKKEEHERASKRSKKKADMEAGACNTDWSDSASDVDIQFHFEMGSYRLVMCHTRLTKKRISF